MRYGLFLFAFCVLTGPGCSSAPRAIDYDVLLIAEPFLVKPVEPGAVADAVEWKSGKPVQPGALVHFKIDKVMVGEFTTVRQGGPTRFEQAQDAARGRDILKLLTLDFSDPDEEYEKKWMTAAVEDPEESFGITDWENPETGAYKLYLKRMPDNPKSYTVVQTVKK